jgi:DNA-directed RNA polymerase subunit H (RpoH/RPB5)
MEITKLVDQYTLARRNLLDMLEERGCDVKSYREFSAKEIKLMIQQTQNNKLSTSVEMGPLDILVKNRYGHQTFVKYRLEKIKAAKSLDSYIQKIYESFLKPEDELIVMIPERSYQISSSFLTLLNNFWNEKGYYIQIFGVNQLLRKVVEHSMVPPHRLMTEKEVEEILKKYQLKEDQLPIILRNDPIAQYYGARPGEVLEITRPSATSGTYLTYRCCY